jgi:hypothetical protein
MPVFQGAVDATFAAFGMDAVYAPAGGEPVSVRVIARRPDTIVGFGGPASMPRPRPSRFARARSPIRALTISSPSAKISSSCKASRNEGTRIGWCGRWMCVRPSGRNLTFGLRRLQQHGSTQSGPDVSAQSIERVARLGRNVRQPNHALAN